MVPIVLTDPGSSGQGYHTMFEILPGAILTTLCGLICIILERQQINLVWELKYYLEREDHPTLAKIIRAVKKPFTPEERKQKQLHLIASAQANIEEFHWILPRELYLLEEKSILVKQKVVNNGLSPEDTASLEGLKKDLRQIKPNLWRNVQEFDDIFISHWFRSSWTLECECKRLVSDEIWKDGQLHCRRRLGCCGCGYGCC